ncbi:hypothetical protein D7S86_17830 [Pararobbsia silviterrae]|uniref:Uncharacterized protein n=1 Tax=Pararobbsia silviterrae TaxID=1792498 RepID=A0A494XMA1_9BURK|nr:hypothetical protein D7S86_17830 [Pararobbsia silviterrae]
MPENVPFELRSHERIRIHEQNSATIQAAWISEINAKYIDEVLSDAFLKDWLLHGYFRQRSPDLDHYISNRCARTEGTSPFFIFDADLSDSNLNATTLNAFSLFYARLSGATLYDARIEIKQKMLLLLLKGEARDRYAESDLEGRLPIALAFTTERLRNNGAIGIVDSGCRIAETEGDECGPEYLVTINSEPTSLAVQNQAPPRAIRVVRTE